MVSPKLPSLGGQELRNQEKPAHLIVRTTMHGTPRMRCPLKIAAVDFRKHLIVTTSQEMWLYKDETFAQSDDPKERKYHDTRALAHARTYAQAQVRRQAGRHAHTYVHVHGSAWMLSPHACRKVHSSVRMSKAKFSVM